LLALEFILVLLLLLVLVVLLVLVLGLLMFWLLVLVRHILLSTAITHVFLSGTYKCLVNQQDTSRSSWRPRRPALL